jgi:hypothetical protein
MVEDMAAFSAFVLDASTEIIVDGLADRMQL